MSELTEPVSDPEHDALESGSSEPQRAPGNTPDVNPLKLPPRSRIERRLREGTLTCALRDASRVEHYALDLWSKRPPVVALVVFALALGTWTIWTSLSESGPSRVWHFLIFDGAAAAWIVFIVLIGLVIRRAEHEQPTRSLVLVIAAFAIAAAIPFAFPHVAFSVIGLDVAFRDAVAPRLQDALGVDPSATEADSQQLLTHLLLTAALIAALAFEVRLSWGAQTLSVARSATKATKRTVADVLRTLPLLLPALFFLVFIEEIWRVIGRLDLPRFLVLLGLTLGCLVTFVVGLARDEANQLLTDKIKTADNELSPALRNDPDLQMFEEAGVELTELQEERRVRRVLVAQCLVHITLRIALAGCVLAGLAFTVMALTLDHDVVNGWLGKPPGGPHDTTLSIPGIGLDMYVATEAAIVAGLVGAFASIVFAATALGAPDARSEHLRPERERLRRLVVVGGTYQHAADKKLWRGERGTRWSNLRDFLGADPMRRRYGFIRLVPTRPWGSPTQPALGDIRWYRKTGELVTVDRPFGEVELLAVCHDQDRVVALMDAAMADSPGLAEPLDTLRARAADLHEPSQRRSEDSRL